MALNRSRFMLITRPFTFHKLITENNFWPFRGRYSKPVAKLKVGDEILVYLSGKSSFVGILKVKSELSAFSKPTIFSGDVYEYYITFEIVKVRESNKLIPINPYLDQLEFTKGKKNWGGGMQRAVRCISSNDFTLIRDKIIN